jgi:hypothetical protein
VRVPNGDVWPRDEDRTSGGTAVFVAGVEAPGGGGCVSSAGAGLKRLRHMVRPRANIGFIVLCPSFVLMFFIQQLEVRVRVE